MTRSLVPLLGAAVAVAVLSLLSAAPANAAPGTQPGTLTISPATGPLSTVPTWSTSSACPPTANASAKLLLVNPDGATLTAFSANINGASTPLTNEPTVAGASVGVLETNAGYTAGKTAELVVHCYSGPSGTGTSVRFQHAFITFNSDATYTVRARSGSVAPTSTDSPASTSTAAAGTPNGAVGTGGGPAPGSDVPMAVGGIALLLVGGGLVLSRWRTAAGSLARRRRTTGEPES